MFRRAKIHPPIIITVFILSVVIILLLKPISNSDSLTINDIKWQELEQLAKPVIPVTTPYAAIQYAINMESIRISLGQVSSEAGFVKWNIQSIKTESKSDNWRVKISSSKMLPSYTCVVTFTADGVISNLPSQHYCRYNK